MWTREEAQKLVEQVMGLTAFPHCQVSLSATEQAYTRFANNGITTASLSMRRNVSIAVTRDSKTGVSSTGDLSPAALKSAVRRAEELAGFAPPNPEWLPPLGAQDYPAIADFDLKTANAGAPEMIPHVKAAIDIAAKRKLVAAGLVERSHHVTAVANKAGLFGFHESADSQMTTTIRKPDGSSSGWAGEPSIRLSELSGERLAMTAADKCEQWTKPIRLDPGNYTVVLEPTAAGDVVRLIMPGFSARNTDEGRTFLSRRGGGTLVGEKLFPEFIGLRSDPFDGRQPAFPWSNDLTPSKPMNWIEKGVVRNVAYDRYWASKTGTTPSGFAGGLTLQGGAASLDRLIASVPRGVLITHFWYIRGVNPQTLQQTGLTRDGVFLIENGKIAAPVMNFRFLESPVRLLKNTTMLGQAMRVRGLEGGMMVAPAMVATDFPLPSISDAI